MLFPSIYRHSIVFFSYHMIINCPQLTFNCCITFYMSFICKFKIHLLYLLHLFMDLLKDLIRFLTFKMHRISKYVKNKVCKIIYWHHNFAMALIKANNSDSDTKWKNQNFSLRPSLLQSHASKLGMIFGDT